jgi:hypothetical protein
MKFEKNNSYAKLGGQARRGVKNRLSSRVLEDMLEVWDELAGTPASKDVTAGKAALRLMRRDRPAEFVKAYVGLVPKELQVESWSRDMSEDELVELIEKFREAEEQAQETPNVTH